MTIADGLSYQAGLLLDSVSLTRLCEDITPIKGYISGKVNGIALIKGGGAGLEGAELAAEAGVSALAVALVRRHQDKQISPVQREAPTREEVLLQTLQSVDDLS